MCGIVGVLAFNKTGIDAKCMDVFKDLMKVITVRGTDGSGIFCVGDEHTGFHRKKQPATTWCKLGDDSLALMATEVYGKMIKDMANSRFLVGHARAATKGEINTTNAHPFQEGSITMVHNGTIDIDMKKDDKRFSVDSHALCYELSQKDPVTVLENVRGPTAVVWYDEKTNLLNIYRNIDRPLYYVRVVNRIYFASEAWMVDGILHRHQIHASAPLMFQCDHLYSFSHDSDIEVIKKIERAPLPASKWNDDEWDPILMKWVKKGTMSKGHPVVNLPARYRKKADNDIDLLRSVAQKFLNHKELGKDDVIPTSSYFSLQNGDRVIFEPTGLQYIDDAKIRGLITGEFRDVLPRRPTPYVMLSDVGIYAKTHKKPKIPAQQLSTTPLLTGKIESIVINKNDAADVRVHLVDVEPFAMAAYEELQKTRINRPTIQ